MPRRAFSPAQSVGGVALLLALTSIVGCAAPAREASLRPSPTSQPGPTSSPVGARRPPAAAQPATAAPAGASRAVDEFPRGAELLSGFDTPSMDDSWRIGDRILCGLQTRRRHEDVTLYALVTVRTNVLKPGQKVIVAAEPPANLPADALFVPHCHAATSVDKTNEFVAQTWRQGISVPQRGGGERTLELDSDVLLVSIEFFDDKLERLSTSHALTTEAHLRNGIYPLTASLFQARQRLGPDIREIIKKEPTRLAVPSERFVSGFVTLYALRNTIWSSPNVVPILQSLIQLPSVWSILTQGGIRFSLDLSFDEVGIEERQIEASRVSLAGQRPLRLPFDILINSQPALRCSITSLPARQPLQLAAGIIAVDVTHPKDPERRLHYRVLAARRGPTPPRVAIQGGAPGTAP